MGKTAIKSTMIIDEFVHHPGSGRATDYQNDVATCLSPSIPEVLQGRDKTKIARKSNYWLYLTQF